MLHIRAWIPTWGAQTDSTGAPWPLPRLADGEFYSLWFVGHADPARLTDEVLDALLIQASDDDVLGTVGEEADDFQTYMELNGYTSFITAAGGQIYLAALPSAQEGGDTAG